MKIEKLPSGNYRVRQMINGKKIHLTFDHRPQNYEILEALEEFVHTNSTPDTFEQCALRYIAMKENVLSPTTIRSYRSLLRNIDPKFKRTPLKLITQVEVQSLINDISANTSPKTVRNYNGFIMTVLSTFAPTTHFRVTMPRRKKSDDYIPSSDEVKAVLSVAKGTKWYIVFMLGCYGLRRSEILPLTLDDVHDDYIDINKTKVKGDGKWVIKDIGKTDASLRKVPVSPELVKLIRDQGFICDFHPDKILQHLHLCQEEAGVSKFRFHLFRHYFCTELSQAHFSEEDIMALGGWSTPDVMKKVYRHQRIKEDQEARNRAANTIMKSLDI